MHTKRPVIFDLGANIGQTTIMYYEIFPQAQIFCFEPAQENFDSLVRNMKANALRPRLHKLGLYNQCTTSRIGMPTPNQHPRYKLRSKSSGLYSLFADCDIKNSEFISLITLDSYVNQEDVKSIDYIKLDTEGAELNILKGAQESLMKFHPILQIEVNEFGSTISRNDPLELFDFLTKFHYIINVVVDNDTIPLSRENYLLRCQKENYHLELLCI